MPNLTAEQSLAVATRGVSVVLASGAGCGKTHVLTARYLSHLRDGLAVGDLVAITFTERAARQMRARIRAALTNHVREAATDDEADVWAARLRDLDAAPIATIHAFCGGLLREFAVEAGIDPRFTVLEGVLSSNLRVEAREKALQALLTDESPVGDDLRELVLLFGWSAVTATVAELAEDIDRASWMEWLKRSPDDVAADWLRLSSTDLQPRRLAHAVRTRPAVARTLRLLREHPPLPGPMAAPVATILDLVPRLHLEKEPASAIAILAESAKVGRVGAKAWPDPAVYERVKSAFEAFRKEMARLEGDGVTADTDDVAPAVAVGQRFLRVCLAVDDAYAATKARHGVLDFNDLLVGARDLLRDHPDIRERVSRRYAHVLIDELQDTDPVQMEFVRDLCGGPGRGTLFAVGDHKQSIYRFRGAEVSLFRSLGAEVPQEGRQKLTVNFRSRPGVLSFVNDVFAPAMVDYEPLVPSLPEGGWHNVEFLWTPRPDDIAVGAARALEAETIARRVSALIAEGVRAGDIVLLFRAMSSVHLYEAALRNTGIDYYLVGGRAFFAQQEVYDILHLLKTLENPQDGLSLAGVLRSPFFCLSDEALFVLGRHQRGMWVSLFDEHVETMLPATQRERVRRARSLLGAWRTDKDRLGVAGLLNRVIADAGYDAALAIEHLGDRKIANLWKLIDLARTFDASGLFGLAEFVARLDDLVATQPREEQAATQPESADVVRLMSIHQAKGLEFPVVIVPDLAAAGGSPHTPQARWHRRLGCVVRPPSDEDPPPFSPFGKAVAAGLDELDEWDEDVRTLYVACTRPVERLVLSASLAADYEPAGAWMQTLASAFDLRTGEGLHGRRVVVIDPATLPVVDSSKHLRAYQQCDPSQVPATPATTGLRLVTMSDIEDRLASGDLFAAAREEGEESRVLRRVLSGDLSRPEGLQARLDRLGARLPADAREGLSRVLSVLTAAEWFAALRKARQRRSKVEYVAAVEGTGAAVCGEIDCLWQDDAERWHVVEWVTTPVGDFGRQAAWEEAGPRLLAACKAWEAASGRKPWKVWLAFVYDGVFEDRPAGKVASKEVEGSLRTALRA